MNLLTATQNNFIEAMQHYFCMRLKFRGTVMQETRELSQLPATSDSTDKENQARH